MDADGPVVRALDPVGDDLEAVARIMAHYVEHTVATFAEVAPTAREWAERHRDLTARGLPFLVATLGDAVVGLAYAAPWRPKAAYRHTVEDTVYVAPGATGRGVGGALLAGLLRRCADAGCRQVVAVVARSVDDPDEPASVALHRRHGFTDAGRLRAVGHKQGTWLDTMLLQRSL